MSYLDAYLPLSDSSGPNLGQKYSTAFVNKRSPKHLRATETESCCWGRSFR